MSRLDPDPVRNVIKGPLGSGSAIKDYVSTDQDPKEIFTDPPQRWFCVALPVVLTLLRSPKFGTVVVGRH
jgi:hypothetical protein